MDFHLLEVLFVQILDLVALGLAFHLFRIVLARQALDIFVDCWLDNFWAHAHNILLLFLFSIRVWNFFLKRLVLLTLLEERCNEAGDAILLVQLLVSFQGIYLAVHVIELRVQLAHHHHLCGR